MANKHADFSLSVCGLIVDPAWPYPGASPDDVINFVVVRACWKSSALYMQR